MYMVKIGEFTKRESYKMGQRSIYLHKSGTGYKKTTIYLNISITRTTRSSKEFKTTRTFSLIIILNQTQKYFAPTHGEEDV